MTALQLRLALTGLLLTIVLAVGCLLAASYYALSLPGDDGKGLALAGVAGAVLFVAWTAFGWVQGANHRNGRRS